MDERGTAYFRALLYGHYHPLLLTRSSLLATIGCDSTVVITMADFQQKVVSPAFDLAVMCQSCNAAERTLASNLVAKHNPHTRLLMLWSSSGWQEPGDDVTVLDVMAGPAQFLQTARLMVEQARARPLAYAPTPAYA